MSHRILLVTDIFPPMIGGPASFIDRLASSLASRGFEVTVVCSSLEPSDPGDASRPFRVRRVPRMNPYLYEIKMRGVLWRELLLHSHVFVNGLERYVALPARVLGRRYILKVVGDTAWERARNLGLTDLDIDCFQADRLAQERVDGVIKIRNRAVSQARAVITPSRHLEGLVRRWGFPAKDVHVIPNGVPRPSVGPRDRRSGLDPLRVLFVGRLTNWKGVDTLLLAAREVDGIEVRIVGDGPAWPALTELAAQLDLDDRVAFTGRLPSDELTAHYAWADVLVLTSLYEGLSHTLLEAMSHGVPCIASDRGGNPETVEHGVSGLVIPPLQPRRLAAALQSLREDPDLRSRLAAGATARAECFSFEDSVNRLIALVQRTWP